MEISLKVDTPDVFVEVQRSVVGCGQTELIVENVRDRVGNDGRAIWEIKYYGSSQKIYEDHLEAIEAARDLVFKLESARLMREQLESRLLGNDA